MNGWQRPAGPLNVWRLVRAEFMNCWGQVEQDILSIQEIPENRMEEALDFFIRYVAPKDPVFCDFGIFKNPAAFHELRRVWSLRLKQGISIAAYRTDRDLNILDLVGIQFLHVEVPPVPVGYLPTLKGGNGGIAARAMSGPSHTKRALPAGDFPLTLPARKAHEIVQMSMKSPQVVNSVQYCLHAPPYNMFKTFTIDKYLCGTSLGVYPAYGVGPLERHLLYTVEDVCRKYEIKVIGSLFFGDQVGLARSAGYLIFYYFSRVLVEGEGPARNPTKLPKFMYRKLA